MKNLYLSTLVFTALLTNFTHAASATFTPHIYSRGGITNSDDLKSQGLQKANFNLGAWAEESNAISDPLTEVTLEAKMDNFTYTYGVDAGNNRRYIDQSNTQTSISERLNFLTFTEDNLSVWFGQRAYRGDGDYLTRAFPFDEHNMYGGGIRLEKVAGLNIEFAYGEKEVQTPRVINLFINKIEKPLSNGKIKTNLELHKVNGTLEQERMYAYMGGIQYQRWGDKFLLGNLYNLFMINYSHGYIYGGNMQSAYNALNENDQASKLVIKWGGDWKIPSSKALYYNFKYQHHEGNGNNEKWVYLDSYLRPVTAISSHIAGGIDLAYRTVLKEPARDLWDGNAYGQETFRAALMLSYHMKEKMFDLPSISLFAGHIIKDKATSFYSNKAASREENFIRLNYEVSI